jgi:hypothetical protein
VDVQHDQGSLFVLPSDHIFEVPFGPRELGPCRRPPNWTGMNQCTQPLPRHCSKIRSTDAIRLFIRDTAAYTSPSDWSVIQEHLDPGTEPHSRTFLILFSISLQWQYDKTHSMGRGCFSI